MLHSPAAPGIAGGGEKSNAKCPRSLAVSVGTDLANIHERYGITNRSSCNRMAFFRWREKSSSEEGRFCFYGDISSGKKSQGGVYNFVPGDGPHERDGIFFMVRQDNSCAKSK